MAVERELQLALVLLLLDRHAENVGGALQEGDVVFAELAFGAAVDLKHAERRTVALQDDVHGAADAVLDQQFGGPEALLVFEMVRDDRLASMQGITGRRCQVGADGSVADHAGVPADAGLDQQPVLAGQIFQNLAVVGAQPFGGHPRGVLEHAGEAGALQRQHAEFGQQFLLTDAEPQRAPGHVVGNECLPGLALPAAFAVSGSWSVR